MAYSTRSLLRSFQKVRPLAVETGFLEDLQLLQSKDLDLSVRLGALLACNALLITTAVNPIAASPGAPVSLDAQTQPWEVALVCIAIILLAISAWYCVRGMLVGEEFKLDGLDEAPHALIQRMLAAWCVSIDVQLQAISRAVSYTLAGGAVTVLSFAWILLGKILG